MRLRGRAALSLRYRCVSGFINVLVAQTITYAHPLCWVMADVLRFRRKDGESSLSM